MKLRNLTVFLILLALASAGCAQRISRRSIPFTNNLGCIDGYDHLPCVVSKAQGTATGNSNVNPTSSFTSPAAGPYRLCTNTYISTAGTAGTFRPQIQYTGDGHNFGGGTGSSITVTSQWSESDVCNVVYADSGTALYPWIAAVSVTGSPTIRYTLTVERLQ